MNDKQKEKYILESIKFQMEQNIGSYNEKWLDDVTNHFNLFPKKLYRYAKLNRYTLDSISKNYIYMCPAFKLDDQFECRIIDTLTDDIKSMDFSSDSFIDNLTDRLSRYPSDISKEQYKRLIRACVIDMNSKEIEKFFKKYGNSFERKNTQQLQQLAADVVSDSNLSKENEKAALSLFKIAYNAYKEIGIGSLTECDKNQVMWEMYAKHYSGVCIEYDFSDDGFALSNTYPVLYRSKKNNNLIMDVIGSQLDTFVFQLSGGKIKEFNNTLKFMQVFLTKYKEWSFQKEWRIIGKPKDKIKVPKIKRIYVGKNVSSKQLEKLRNIAAEKNIMLYEQFDDFDTLQIKYKPLK